MIYGFNINENFQISQDIDGIESGDVKTLHAVQLLRKKYLPRSKQFWIFLSILDQHK